MTIEEMEFQEYESGYLNNYGGGNVDWWWDYIRSEVQRANDNGKQQYDSLLSRIKELKEGIEKQKAKEDVGCPFCGEKEDLYEYSSEEWKTERSVRCENCGALGPPCSTWKQAKDSWQHRVIPGG